MDLYRRGISHGLAMIKGEIYFDPHCTDLPDAKNNSKIHIDDSFTQDECVMQGSSSSRQ